MPLEIEIAARIFIFLIGLCIGSFLNVVIHRLPLGESIVWPASRCPSCRKAIPWHQNIPVLSFLFLRAKCGQCQAPISWRYPAVEIITALLFSLAAWREPYFPAWPFQFFFLSALVACTFIDLDHWILPDKITLPGIVIGLLSAFVVPGHDILMAVIGCLLGGGILYAVAWGYLALTGKDGLGGGDIKFLAMVGAFLGPKGAFITLILSSLVGSILGLGLIFFRGKKGNTAIPFGPFLAGGSLLAFFFGEPLWQWYFGLL